jgi:hypothetical protein
MESIPMAPVHSVRPPSHLSAMGMDFIDFLGDGHRLALVFKSLRQKKRNIKLLENQHRRLALH